MATEAQEANSSEEQHASVFISYAREDIAFVGDLQESLKEHNQESWVDLGEIRPTEEWLARVYSGIDGSNAFVFVISPDSVNSKSCLRELARAVEHNKRLIPIVHRDVDDEAVPDPLRTPQWIFFRDGDDFGEAVQKLVDALDTDLEWVDAHTRLLTRAIEWNRSGRNSSFLLRGSDLSTAEEWQARAADKEPKLTALQTEYILAGRRATTRRQRLTLGAVIVGLVVAVVLGSLAWWQRNEAIAQRNEAVQQRNIALSRQLTTQAIAVEESQPDASLLLDVEALRRARMAAAIGKEDASTAKQEAHFDLLSKLDRPYHIATTITGHTDVVGSVSFSPDGKLLASGGDDGMVHLWDVESGKSHGEPLTSHQTEVYGVAFSPDGKLLAAGGTDGTVRLWDVESGKQLGEPLSGPYGAVLSVSFSPDGKLLAAGGADGKVHLWDVPSGKSHGDWETGNVGGLSGGVTSLAFSPDGKLLALAKNEGVVRLLDVESGKLHGEPLTVLQGEAYRVSFSPDGKLLAAGGDDGMVRLWDVESGKSHGEPLTGHTDAVTAVAFSPDGKLLASGGIDGTARLWDVESGKPYGEPLIGHTSAVWDVAFSPNGKLLASASGDETVRLWDVASRWPLGQHLNYPDDVSSVAFSPDGKLLAPASYDTISLLDVASRQLLAKTLTGHTDWVQEAAFSPDGKLLASGGDDGTLRLWDVESGKQLGESLLTLQTDWWKEDAPINAVGSLAFSPDGKLLASGDNNGMLRLWDVPSGKSHGEPLTSHQTEVYGVAFSPDGKLLASGGIDGTVRLWDVESGKQLGEPLIGHSGYVYSVAFSPNGKLLASASTDHTVHLWDVESGKLHGEPLTGHQDEVWAVAFSPNGKLLASGGIDGTVRLWDVESGKQLGEPLTGHQDEMWDVAFSPNGKLLASGGDETVLLWNIEEETLMAKACTTANRELTKEEWNRFVGPEFDYVRTCSSLPASYGVEEYVTNEFKPALRFKFDTDWEFASPETADTLFIWTVPEENSISFTNPLHVFDPSSLNEPKERPVPEDAAQWIAWLQRHPNLDTSKPVPVRVGGVSGKQIDATYNSTSGDYPRDLCGQDPCVPLYKVGSTVVLSYDGWKDRFVILDVGKETVIIDIAAPTDEFDAFSPDARKVLDTVDWKAK